MGNEAGITQSRNEAGITWRGTGMGDRITG